MVRYFMTVKRIEISGHQYTGYEVKKSILWGLLKISLFFTTNMIVAAKKVAQLNTGIK